MGPAEESRRHPTHTGTARLVLAAFAFTFIASRMLVYLIMSRRIPNFFFHLGETHVHHLNYGIFLLSGVGAYLLFLRPEGRARSGSAIAYGIGLALTFDEFGMWLHLGGSYWQRASFDAVVVIAALLGLIAASPTLRHFRPRHWTTAILLALAVTAFAVLLVDSFRYAGKRFGPRIRALEESGPR